MKRKMSASSIKLNSQDYLYQPPFYCMACSILNSFIIHVTLYWNLKTLFCGTEDFSICVCNKYIYIYIVKVYKYKYLAFIKSGPLPKTEFGSVPKAQMQGEPEGT